MTINDPKTPIGALGNKWEKRKTHKATYQILYLKINFIYHPLKLFPNKFYSKSENILFPSRFTNGKA